MQIARKLSIPLERPWLQKAILLAAVFAAGMGIFLVFPTQSVDWVYSFYPTAGAPLHPYGIRFFLNPPWTALMLAPLHLFPVRVSQAINCGLNLTIITALVLQRKGRLLAVCLTLTSLPFLSLLANGSIEWTAGLAFFVPNGLGFFILLSKPQSGLFAGLDWFLRSRRKWLFILVPAIGLALSFLVWGFWPEAMLFNIAYAYRYRTLMDYSYSVFPWLVLPGIGLLAYIIWKRPANGELLGVIATFCITPYVTPQSLTILFALCAAAYPRRSIALWAVLWAIPFIQHWGSILQILGVR